MPDNSELVNALSGGGLLSSIANPRVMSPNLLADAYGKGSDIAASMWHNRLAQSQQAVGENLLAATGQDGTVDTGKLAALNARNPTTALSAGASAQTGQTLRANDMGFNQAQQMNIGKTIAGVLQAPDAQQTPENYKAAIDFSFANHSLDRSHYDTANKALAAAGNDPAALRAFGTRIFAGTLAGPEVAQFVMPTTGTVTGDGGRLIGYVGRPGSQGGGVSSPSQPGASQGPDAGTLSSVSTITDSKGIPHTDSLAGHIRAGRVSPMGVPAPGYSAAPGGGNYSTQPLLGGMKTPTPGSADILSNPDMAGQTEGPPGSKATPVPTTGPRSGGTAGPAPGTVEAANTTARQSAESFKGISDQSVAARSRGAVLDNMLADTSQFTSGPGTDVIARVRAVANRLGLNVNTEGLSAVESFKKLAAALNAGQGSDARLSVSEASNPHADLSPAGIDLMLRQLRGNEDYNQARGKLAAAHPDKTNIASFEDKTGSQLDPRTFQYDRMTGPQKKTYFNSLPDKAKFVKAHDAAAALLPGGQ